MRHLGKIVEFEKVYLEYPDELVQEQAEDEEQEKKNFQKQKKDTKIWF